MDTSDPSITFDSSGICDHCLTFQSSTIHNWQPNDPTLLQSTLAKIRSKGRSKDYDCLIGMSGGIDSSYLLHYAVKELKLRPLVFHVDAGWNSNLAVSNIEVLTKSLGVDVYTHVIPWHEMRDLQLSLFKAGVPHIDAAQDHAFFATMYRFASKYNIKSILTGANIATEGIRNPKDWMYFQSDAFHLRHIHKAFGTLPLKDFPFTNVLWHKVYLPFIRRVKVYRILDLIPYTKEVAARTLQETYGWTPYPQKHFESRFTRFYESYWLPERFGYDVRKVQYSSLILSGQMTRTEALNMLNQPSYDHSTIDLDKDYICKKLSISRDTLEHFFSLPHRSYKDYPSLSLIYKLGTQLTYTLGLSHGLKR